MLLLGVLTIPSSIINLYTYDTYRPIFACTLMVFFPFFYIYVRNNMDYYINIKIFDIAICSLLIAGIFTKITEGIVYGPLFAPNMNPIVYGMISRGGGVNASNHIAGIILMIMPLANNIYIRLSAIIFLLFTFSRGAYAALVFITLSYLIYRIFGSDKIFGIKINVLKIVFLFAFINILMYLILPDNIIEILFREFFNRLTAFSIINENQRFDIFSQSLQIFDESYWMGVGITNYASAYVQLPSVLGTTDRFSNAHNLYLTLLVENGIPFFLVFIYLLYLSLEISFKYSKRSFLAILVFCFYGFFSGQLYESGVYKFSLYDYYYFAIIIAYAEYMSKFSYKKIKISIC